MIDWLARTAETIPPLSFGAIHVWSVRLDCPAPSIDLPGEDRAWIEAAIDKGLARRRHHSRSATRALLGRYAGRDPAALRFARNAHGKPHLVSGEVAFNLSHSDDFMLLAVAENGEIGIDIDRLDRLNGDWRTVAKASLSRQEWAALETVPERERASIVMRIWVRKEAYTKARGMGFAHGFTAVSVGADLNAPSAIKQDTRCLHDGAEWTLMDLPMAPELAAAIAFSGELKNVSLFRQSCQLNC